MASGTHGPASLQPEYIALESLSQDYGFELLGMCRNQSEVTAVLNDLDEDSETEPEAEGLTQAFEEGIPNLARLRLAVNYNQKRVSRALPTTSPHSCLALMPCPATSKYPLSNPKGDLSPSLGTLLDLILSTRLLILWVSHPPFPPSV